MWEKEKLLVTSNFSFSNSVFKRLVSQRRQKVSLRGNGLKGLILYQKTIFRFFQIKEFADNNFRFDENDGVFSKWVANTVGKGEIARYQQSLPFP